MCIAQRGKKKCTQLNDHHPYTSILYKKEKTTEKYVLIYIITHMAEARELLGVFILL